MSLAVQQETTILKEDKGFFLVIRTICYDTGFERGIELVGSRYEIWNSEYKDKYEKDIIEEYREGKVVHYCQLYTAGDDEEMIKIFDAKIRNDKT